MEATDGHGFDRIIEKDYAELSSDDDRKFVVLVGLATIHRLGMPESIASRAVKHMGIQLGIPELLQRASGIVRRSGDLLMARHPIYIEHLFDIAVTTADKISAIHALLNAFTVYNRPLMKSVGRNAGNIFKFTLNYNFLKNILRGDDTAVIDIYESFAKAFQDDGWRFTVAGLQPL